jgi:hypothetical protein
VRCSRVCSIDTDGRCMCTPAAGKASQGQQLLPMAAAGTMVAMPMAAAAAAPQPRGAAGSGASRRSDTPASQRRPGQVPLSSRDSNRQRHAPARVAVDGWQIPCCRQSISKSIGASNHAAEPQAAPITCCVVYKFWRRKPHVALLYIIGTPNCSHRLSIRLSRASGWAALSKTSCVVRMATLGMC